MTDFLIENGVLIHYNGNVSHVVIPDGVTKISDFAFAKCYTLKNIEIPNSVSEIGDGAFSKCEKLTSIEIPNSVISIGHCAFCDCKSLKNIKLPNSVANIGYCVFGDINKIKPQYKTKSTLRAFKAFDGNWACMYDFRYEVGKSYHQNGKIECCENGFHACPNPLDIFGYYSGNVNDLHFAEVELSGEMDSEYDKVAASDIKIVRELTLSELADIYNKMAKGTNLFNFVMKKIYG